MLLRLVIISSVLFTVSCGSDDAYSDFGIEENGEFDVVEETDGVPDPTEEPEPESEAETEPEELPVREYRVFIGSMSVAGSGPTPSVLKMYFDLPGACVEMRLENANDWDEDPNPFDVEVDASREVNLALVDIVTDGTCGRGSEVEGQRVESATGLITTNEVGIKLDVTVRVQGEDFFRRIIVTEFDTIYL